MPINHLLKERHSFGPDEIKVLATAFDAALLELGLGRTDTAALLVAKRIVALAQGGECDPTRLREGAVKGISQPRAPLRSSATKKRQASTFASALLYRAVPLGAPMGAGLPWPVVCGADVVVFATSVTILLTP
jgi:hypothetical protein